VAPTAASLHLRLAFKQLLALWATEYQSGGRLFCRLFFRLGRDRKNMLALAALSARAHQFRCAHQMMFALGTGNAQFAIGGQPR
jgi:hypothetical protein